MPRVALSRTTSQRYPEALRWVLVHMSLHLTINQISLYTGLNWHLIWHVLRQWRATGTPAPKPHINLRGRPRILTSEEASVSTTHTVLCSLWADRASVCNWSCEAHPRYVFGWASGSIGVAHRNADFEYNFMGISQVPRAWDEEGEQLSSYSIKAYLATDHKDRARTKRERSCAIHVSCGDQLPCGPACLRRWELLRPPDYVPFQRLGLWRTESILKAILRARMPVSSLHSIQSVQLLTVL